MSKIKTFRGLIADGGQDRIRITHIDGKIGYRIKKFELQFNKPGTQSTESIVKIFSIKQTAIDGIINFSEQTLLAASFLSGSTSATYPEDITTIFDTVIFNQDIFVTHSEVAGSEPCNYYLELEQFNLDDNEATATILKNFRNTNSYAT